MQYGSWTRGMCHDYVSQYTLEVHSAGHTATPPRDLRLEHLSEAPKREQSGTFMILSRMAKNVFEGSGLVKSLRGYLSY